MPKREPPTKTILVVEDNSDLRMLLKVHLKILRYESIFAANGQQAVNMAASQKPDLILMDIILPEMDGLEATRLIRKDSKSSSIPILAVTALSGPKAKEACLKYGCNDYIPKPFTVEELGTRIESLLEQDSPRPRSSTG